jgi:hypothetical protein
MVLASYKNNLFEEISSWVQFEYDKETSQYSVINESTPWIYWLWDTKSEAVWEYLSGLRDMILVDDWMKDEYQTQTIA